MSNAAPPIDVPYVAQLARLDLSPEETRAFQEGIARIVQYVQLLDEADVTGVEPTAHASPIFNVFREDAPGPCVDREPVLANAPDTVNDELVRVPPVLGGDEGAP